MADKIITPQELIDAQKDAQTLEEVVNAEPNTVVTSRLGRLLVSLATIGAKTFNTNVILDLVSGKTQKQINDEASSALSDRYTKVETDSALNSKANKATTLAGYGITDAYDKKTVDTTFAAYVGGRKAFQTLALAQAATGSLAANTAIEVTNDSTASNNGTYQWNGTALTKSAYDPVTQAKSYTDEKIIKSNYSDNLLEISDGTEEQLLLAAFKNDGTFVPTKYEAKVQSVINAVGNIQDTDLIIETDNTADQVIVRRVDQYGVNHGSWEGTFPARLENAGASSIEALNKANQALALLGSGKWGKLKQRISTIYKTNLNAVRKASLGLTAEIIAILPTSNTKTFAVGHNPEYFNYIGGTPTPYGSLYGFHSVTRVSGANLGSQKHELQVQIEFMTDSLSPCLRVEANGGLLTVLVDDVKYSDADYTALTGGGNCWLKLNFSTRRTRKITLVTSQRFGGVVVEPIASVWKPVADELRVTFVGDSFTDGSIATISGAYYPYTIQLSKLLGVTPWVIGVGSTGYTNDGTSVPANGRFGSDNRVADAVRSNPDFLIFFGSVNDYAATGTEVQAAALACWQKYRTALGSDVPFLIFGVPAATTGPSAKIIELENGLIAAFEQFADQNSSFIPVTTDAQGAWEYGTGYISSSLATLNNSGNTDVYIGASDRTDGTHPNVAGHLNIAERMAQSIYQISLEK